MNEKVIFEIPIYPYSEKEFEKRWRPTNDWFKALNQRDYERTGKYTPCWYFPQNVWKYNQINGYIVVSVTFTDVAFYLYLCNKSRFIFKSTKKNFMQYYPILGLHFYALKMTELEIIQRTREMLSEIVRENIEHSYYIDYTVFDNIINQINIKMIMNTMGIPDQ
jgi:hypothetical protein